MFGKKDSVSVAKQKLYREETNVFAYYTLKTILLLNASDFFAWCRRNNTENSLMNFSNDPKSLNALYDFIVEKHREDYISEKMKKMGGVMDGGGERKSRRVNYFYYTMRMSAVELKTL